MGIMRKFIAKLASLFLGRKVKAIPRYENFEDALKSCAENGYANSDLVGHVVNKNILFRDEVHDKRLSGEALRVLPAIIASIKIERLHVLDFGGGGGAHFNSFRSILDNSSNILWCVIETEEMVRMAQQRGLENDSLRFFKAIEEALNYAGFFDLVLTSSALQYCADPAKAFESLVNLKARSFYITRTPFINGHEPLITVQKSRLGDNGSGLNPSEYVEKDVYYPITYMSKAHMMAILSEQYEVRFEFDESAGIVQIEGVDIEMPSIFASIKKLTN